MGLPKLAPWLRLIPPEMAPFLAAPNTNQYHSRAELQHSEVPGPDFLRRDVRRGVDTDIGG